MSGLTVNLTSSALKYISSSANGKRSICYVQNVGTLFTTGEVNSGSSWTLLTDLSSVITNAASLSYDGRYQSVSDVYGNVYVSSSYGAAGTWSQRYVNTTNTNFTPMPAKVAMSVDGKYQVATVFKNQITSKIAGGASPGFSGDGGLASSAQLHYQTTVAFDSSNNIILSDAYNHRIRRIVASTGIISTIAGTASTGFPTGGTATSQNLWYPFGLSIDSSGSYICNSYHGVFKITGTNLTVMGGSGTSAFSGDGSAISTSTRFGSPQQNCIDSFGNIYITDGANRRIRRIAAGTNIVTTICGNGTNSSTGDGGLATAATLNPSGICVDSFNNIYISDATNNRVRRIDAVTGIITTICGNGTGTSIGDGGAASSATVAAPMYLCCDRANNLYIAEYGTASNVGGNRIRKITARNGILSGSCIISTYAGTGNYTSGGVGGAPTAVSMASSTVIAFDMFDNAYFSDNGICNIIKATQYASIIRSSDYGQTWSIVTPSISGVAFNNLAISKTGQYATATSLGGAIYRSTDYGATWAASSSVSRNWGAIAVSSTGQYQIAAGYDMTGYYSTDYGVSWTLNSMPNGNWSSINLSATAYSLIALPAGSTVSNTFLNNTVTDLKALGYSDISMVEMGITALDFKNIGYTISQIYSIGFVAAADYKSARYSIYDLSYNNISFTPSQLVTGGYTAADFKSAGYSVSEVVALGFSLESLYSTGLYSYSELTPLGYSLSFRSIDLSNTSLVTHYGASTNNQYQICYLKNTGTFVSNSYGAASSWRLITDLSSVITNSASLSYNGKIQSVSDVYGSVYTSSSYGAAGTWSQRYVNTTNTNFTVMPAKVAMSLDGKIQVATVFKNQITSRFAGVGGIGYSGDGGLATSANLSWQPDIKFDASNNAIIGDGYNRRVRRINASTGIITTIAGTGGDGFPTGGVATSQLTPAPRSIIVDASGNYIVSCHHGLLKITGTTLSVMGGSGTAGFAGDGSVFSTSSRINSPMQCCMDSSGNIYTAMQGDYRIRKISAGTNILSTIFGNGTSVFSGDNGPSTSASGTPFGICTDSYNNIYFTDITFNRIRRIDAVTGIVTTICGTGARSSTGDGGPAISATLSEPYLICCDKANNLYIPEGLGCRVRKITAVNGILSSSCIISTYAGTGTEAPSVSTGLGAAPTAITFRFCTIVAIDMFDNIYFVDNGGAIIKATQYASIIRSTDYGQTWSIATPSISNVAFNNLAVSKSGQYATATSLGGAIYRSTDYGATWTASSSVSKNWGAIAVSSTGQYQIAAGYDMTGYYSTDYGQSWTLNGMPNGNWSSINLSATAYSLIALPAGSTVSNTFLNNTVTHLKSLGYSDLSMVDMGITATDFKTAGYSFSQVLVFGYTSTELKNAGFTLDELKSTGLSDAALVTLGYTATDFKNASYTISQVYALGFTNLTDLSAYSVSELVGTGYFTYDNLFDSGLFDYLELTPFGYYKPGFIFDISSSVWNALATKTYPLVNAGGSFTDVNHSFIAIPKTGKTQVVIYWGGYTNLNVNDGLNFFNTVSYYNHPSLTIKQFGNITLANMPDGSNGCFKSFTGTILATDVPKLPQELCGCFMNSTSSNFGKIGSWDVSGVTSLKQMFLYASNFNQDISGWNVSNVTSLNNTFYGTASFNQPLNPWNTSSVVDMNGTFGASAFNQPIGNWNVSAVTSMGSMFVGNSVFNQPLNSWNTSSLTNISSMFFSATVFNQPIESWNVSAVTNMYGTFFRADAFNQPLGNWNVSAVTTMNRIFMEADAFNQPLDSWNVSAVKNMENMFTFAVSFNQPLNSWNVSAVTNMYNMFWGATSFNQPLNSWNVSAVTDMTSMFTSAAAFNQSLSSWNTVSAITMSNMFTGATAFNKYYGKWNFTNATTLTNMFASTANDILKKSILLHDLSNNTTFNGKNLGVIDSYLNNTATAAAVTTLTSAPRNNVISGTAVTPVLSTFKTSGYSPVDLIYIGYTLADLKTAGYSISDVSASGIVYTPSQYRTAGYTASDFKSIGYTAAQVYSVGFVAAADYKNAGFSLYDLSFGSLPFTSAQMVSGGYTAADFKAIGYSVSDVVALGFSLESLYSTGLYSYSELNPLGYSLSFRSIDLSNTSLVTHYGASTNNQYQICYLKNTGTFVSNSYGAASSWRLITDLSSVITNSASLSYNGKVQSVSDVYGNVYVSSSFGASGTWTQRYVNTTNTNFTVMPAKVSMSLDGKFQVATVFKNQITSVIAGNGIPGFSGDGGLATSAQLNYDTYIKFDASNNIIISEPYNNRVRRINASTGIITTIAGTGTTGFPTGGVATSQNLLRPFSTNIDASGNYIISSHHGITKMTGNTLTVLGGSGTAGFAGDGSVLSSSTRFSSPQRACIDPSGNIYFADTENNRIRKIAAGTNIVSTICGTGASSSTGDGGLATSATIKDVRSICLDSFNNIYISETWLGNRVRRIDAVTGIITTICGNGTNTTTSGDGGPASSATISTPINLCCDRANNLYIAEYGINTSAAGNRVRKITARNGILSGSCIISTYAGTGTYASSGVGGAPTAISTRTNSDVCIDMFDNIYFNEQGNCNIYKATQYASIIRSADYGQTWSIVTPSVSGVAFNNLAISKSGQYATATSLGGVIYRSIDYGATWAASSSVSKNWGAIALSSTGQYQIAAGYDMTGYYSTDYGQTWTLNGMPNGNWSSINLSATAYSLIALPAGSTVSSTFLNNSITHLKSIGYSDVSMVAMGFTATDFKTAGYTVSQVYNLGFTAVDLNTAGYTGVEIVSVGVPISVVNAMGVSVNYRTGGYTVAQVYALGYTLAEIYAYGYTASEFKAAGYAASQIYTLGFTLIQLYSGGYSPSELQTAGFSILDLSGAGVSISDFRLDNYSIADLITVGYTVSDLRSGGYTSGAFKTAGYGASTLQSAGFTGNELRLGGFTVTELLGANFTESELKSSGFSADSFKTAGYTASELVALNFTAAELKAGSYSLSEVVNASFTPSALFSSGVYDYSELVAGGYSLPGCIFDISSSVWNSQLSVSYPIQNAGGSFSDLSLSAVAYAATNKTNVWIQWSSYSKQSANDGLKFNTNVNYFNEPSIVIKQFGSVPLVNMTDISNGSFYLFAGKITATDAPVLSNPGLAYCFYNSTVSSFGNLYAWDTSGVTNMTRMFSGCSAFNQDISGWNTAAVTNMSGMFAGCSLFDKPVGTWNTSAVTNMSSMFSGCSVFNKPLGTWNTSAVTNMSFMFSGCSAFNQDISGWNVSNVTNMESMFAGCTYFNQNITGWVTSKVTNMNLMFYNSIYFDQRIGTWNYSLITNLFDYLAFTDFSNNHVKTSILLQDLSNNPTFGDENIDSLGSYLNNTKTQLAVSALLARGAVFDAVAVTPVPSNFKSLGYTAANLLLIGYTASELRSNGYTASELRTAGVSLATLVDISYSLVNLTNAGYVIVDFKTANIPISTIITLGYSVVDMKGAGYTATELRTAGVSLTSILAAEYSVLNIRTAGFTATDLKTEGTITISTMLAGGYTVDDLRVATYTATELLGAGASLGLTDLVSGGYSAASLKAVGYTATELRGAGMSLASLKAAEYTSAELIAAGYAVSDFRAGGYTVAEMVALGYSNIRIKNGGYTVAEFKTAGYTISQLLALGFTDANLVAGGFSASDYKTAGYTFAEMVALGFSSASLRNAGYTAAELKAAGYTISAIVAAGFSLDDMFFTGVYDFADLTPYGYSLQGLVYDISSSAWNNTNPVNNTGSSFTGLTYTAIPYAATNKTNVVIQWASYTNQNANDGLNFRTRVNYYNNASINIKQFGGIPLSTMSLNTNAPFNLFAGRITATDSPTFPNKTLMNCFDTSPATNLNIGVWDTSGVTNMSYMFSGSNFNGDISGWNTASVTNMAYMFFRSKFNTPIGQWNVGAVTNMNATFSECVFNQDISGWNVGAVTNMTSLFFATAAYKYSIANWNFTAATSLGSILNATGFNPLQASRLIIDLCNNATFTGKNIGSFVSYLNSSRTGTAFSTLTTAPRSNTISAPAVTPNLSTFKTSGYLPSDLVYIGYGLSDLRTANYTIADLSNSNLVYSAAELKTAGYTAKNFKDAGYTINTLISLGFSVTEIRAAGFTPDQVISLGGYTLDSLFRTGLYDYSDLVPYGYYIPGCIFDVSSTLWNTIITNTSPISIWPASYIYPVINTGGSFTDLSFETVPCLSTGKTNIIIKWSSFTKKSEYDGFIMLGVSYHNHASINIKQFGNIPLTNSLRINGNGFAGCFISFSGVITATDTPLLVNTNYAVCFAYSPNTSFGSLPKWDLSGVTVTTRMFQYCGSFNQDISGWNTSAVTDMSEMFDNCRSFNQSINTWNVSNVTNMTKMFNDAFLFNQPLNAWNVSNVTNMTSMFTGCLNFNQSLNSWNVSNVTNMSGIFFKCNAFNQPLSNWNTSNVTNLASAFESALSFNQPLNSWNVSNVITMQKMFMSCYSFNQPLSDWNTSNVVNMSSMFHEGRAFNQDISRWNVSKVTNMSAMFHRTQVFNQDISRWNVSNVTDMGAMFNLALAFNRPLNTWNISKVTIISGMFQNAYAFNQDISTWDMYGIPDIASMFNGATNYTQSVGAWNFTTINDFTTAFINSGFSTNFLKTSLFIIDLANNPTVTSKNLGNLGKYLNNTTTAAAVSVLLSRSNTLTGTTAMTPDITTFKTSGYSISDLLAVGYTLSNLYTANYTLADLSNSGLVYTPSQLIAAGYTALAFKNAGYTFEQIVSYGFEVADLVKAGFSVSQIMTLGYSPDQLFYGGIYDYSDLVAYGYSVPGFVFDLSSSVWNALPSPQYPIVNTGGSFSDLSFSAIPTITTGKTHVVIRWSSYTNRSGSDGLSFAGVSYSNHASIVIKQFDSIPLRNMVDASSSVFYRFAGRIVALDTPAIVNPGMAYCFANASTGSTGYGRVGAWNLTDVTNISYMFAGATGFNSDISGWNTAAVTNMAGAFQGCSAFNQDLRGWNVANVTDMSGMFSGAVAFNSDISGWNVSKVVNMSNMFNGATVFGASVGKWNVTAATSMINLVNGTRFSTNYLKASMLLQDMSNNTAFTSKALGTIGTYYLNNTRTATAVTRLATYPRSNTFSISATTPNLSTFKTSGYSATDLVYIGYTVSDLRTAGYSLTELSGISIAPADLKLFGYTVANFKAAGGYTLAQIYAIGYPLADFRSAGYSLSELIGVGASPMDLFTSGVYDYSELVPHGLSIPGFLFDLSSSVWNALSPVVYPVVNTGGSFTDLCFNVIPNTFTSKTNVWVRWSSYTNSGSGTGDGLKFGTAVSYSNHPSIVIKQFGSIPLVQMTDISSSAFYRFSGRITATDTPRISQNGLAFCFYNNATVSGGGNGISGGLNIGGGCSEFGNIGAWDVSGVTNMSSMFFGCSLFNSDISGWNVSAVTNMSSMFAGATTFNSAIGGWNVSSVTNMSSMFAGATAFNRDISGWNIGNVVSMPNMFKGAASFEQPIGNWNFSSVTNMVGLLDGSAGFVTDFVKTSILLQDLSNNPTFTGKVVGPIGSYLNNPQTAAAVTSILNKDVVIAATPVTPDPATFKTAGYTAAELVEIGYSVSNLASASYTVADLKPLDLPVTQLLSVGYSVSNLYDASYTVVQLLNADISVNTIASAGYSVSDLKNADVSLNVILATGNYTVTDLKTSGYTVSDLSDVGIPVASIVSAGYSIADLSDAGVSIAAVVSAGYTSVETLKTSGYTAADLKTQGIDLSNLIVANYTVANLRDASYTALELVTSNSNYTVSELKTGGYSAADLKTAGKTLTELLTVGYLITDLSAASYTAAELKTAAAGLSGVSGVTPVTIPSLIFANYSVSDLRTAGYTATEIKTANVNGVGLTALVAGGYTLSELVAANYSAYDLKLAGGYSASDMRTIGGFSVVDLNSSGYTSAELRAGGFTAATFKTAGFSLVYLKNAGFTAAELKSAGYVPSEFKSAGFTVATVVGGGFTLAELKTSGYQKSDYSASSYTPTDLNAAGFNRANYLSANYLTADLKPYLSASTLKGIGYSVIELRSGGFTIAEVIGGGFTLTQLKMSGYKKSDYQAVPYTILDLSNATFDYASYTDASYNIYDLSGLYTGDMLNDIGFPMSTILNANIYLSGFIFEISAGLWDANGSLGTPIRNTQNSFVNLTAQSETIDSITIGRYSWSSFTNTPIFNESNGNYRLDGLIISQMTNRSSPSFNIRFFGGIRLGYNYVAWGNAFTGSLFQFGGSITAKDSPQTVSNMRFCFGLTTGSIYNIGHWDMSGVTNMQSMFYNATKFNTDISGWNVSTVTNMASMFNGASSFNQPIGGWNVSNVTSMNEMFQFACKFNQPIGQWNVSKVTNMWRMFWGQIGNYNEFNQDISGWNVSSVTNMSGMFSACNFNQPIGGWNVSNVTNMEEMFKEAQQFNQDISGWDVSKVTNLSGMFSCASKFNKPIGNWKLSKATNINSMFSAQDPWGKSIFNQDISKWDVSGVTDMAGLFFGNQTFNGDISGWNVSKVTDMTKMFAGTNFNKDISKWDVSKVTNMSEMFSGAGLFNQDISVWNVSSVTNMTTMFYFAKSFNQPIGKWNVSKVTTMQTMFGGNTTIFNQDISGWDTRALTNTSYMFWNNTKFNQNIGSWNYSSLTNSVASFLGATGITPFTVNLILNTLNNNPTIVNKYFTSSTALTYLPTAGINAIRSSLSSKGIIVPLVVYNGTGYKPSTFSSPTYSVTNAIRAGFTLTDLSNSGFVRQDYLDASYNVANLKAASFTALQLKPAGFSLTELIGGGFTLSDVRSLGYAKADFVAAGYSISQLKTAGFTASDFAASGYTVSETVTSGGYTLDDFKAGGFSLQKFIDAGFTIAALKNSGFTRANYIANSITPLQLFNSNLYTVSDLHALGFSYYEMINSGIKMNGFIFDVSNSVWNAATNKYPIKNTGGSFSGLSTSFVQSTLTGLTTGFITWNSYTNLNVNDGLSFHSSVVSYSANEKSIRVLQFAGIPLANMVNKVGCFAQFGGSILATDVPSITNKNMDGCFYKANTQVFGNIDSWDVSGVTTMIGTFNESKINVPIGSWNVSNVTNMYDMFRDATLFNQSISGWDVSKVTSMLRMFNGATAFNGDISGWNTPSLTNMDYILYNAGTMLSNVGGWNFTNVTAMSYIYNYPGVANNGSINVNIMGGTLFLMSLAKNPTILNKTNSFTINDIRFIGTPTVLALYNDMVRKRPNFNFFWNYGVNVDVLKDYNFTARQYNTIGFAISTILYYPFSYRLIDLSNSGFQKIDYTNNSYSISASDLASAGFSVQNLADAGYSFAEIKALGFPLSAFVSTNFSKSDYLGLSYNVTDLSNAGFSISKLNDIGYVKSDFVTLGLTPTQLKQSAFSILDLKNMNYTVSEIIAAGFTLSQVKVAGFVKQDYVASGYSIATLKNGGFTSADFIAAGYTPNELAASKLFTVTDLISFGFTYADLIPAGLLSFRGFIFDISSSVWTNANKLWAGSTVTNKLPIVNTSGTFTDLSFSAVAGANGITTVFVTWRSFIQKNTLSDGLNFSSFGMAGAYSESVNILQFGGMPILNYNTSAAQHSPFYGFAGRISAVDVPVVRTTNLSYFFYNSTCRSFGNIGRWNVSAVTHLSYMFYHDTESFFNADISAWNVGKVVNMSGLFGNAKSFNRSIGSWNVSKVKTMDRMFLGCVAYNQPMNKWNVTQVTSMSYMFSGTQNFQQDIGSWKTTNVNDMSYMFYNAILYNLNFSNWNYTKVTSMAGFIGSTTGYNLAKTGALFVRLSKNPTFSKKRINLPTGNISYLATPTSIAAVSSLVGAKKNVIAATQIVPVITSFKPLNYAISDLTTLGYKLADLLK